MPILTALAYQVHSGLLDPALLVMKTWLVKLYAFCFSCSFLCYSTVILCDKEYFCIYYKRTTRFNM